MNGPVLYSRSVDGGATWDPDYQLLDGINSSHYSGWWVQSYQIEAHGDVVAILLGGISADLVLMKSEDGGDNWEKTVIWEHPYPMAPADGSGLVTDPFYCPDGARELAIGPSGKVHVAFGITRVQSDDGWSYWLLVDGLGYWNEDRPGFSNNLDALCPYDDCEYSELIEDYSLIGWAQDLNGNGEWDILGEIPPYNFKSATSFPAITIDEQDRVFVIWSAITEGCNNGMQDYRRLWARASPNGGDWWGEFVNLTEDMTHTFDECVWPSVSQTSDDYLYLIYQIDNEPGNPLEDGDTPTECRMNFMKVAKTEISTGIREPGEKPVMMEVGEVAPNPVDEIAMIRVDLQEQSVLTVEVTSLTGQVVMARPEGRVSPGLHTFRLDVNGLPEGIYFCSVKTGAGTVTRKFIKAD
jgi:hypothetical protein